MDSVDNFQPLPKSSSFLDELVDGECMAETLHEFPVMQGHNNAANTCNNLEDRLLDVAAMGDPDMYCADGCWPDDVFGRCEHASYVETDKSSNMKCSLDMIWESWLQATSPLINMECVDVWEKWLDCLGQSQAPDANGLARRARDHYHVELLENAKNMECSLDMLRSSVEATRPSATTECCTNIWENLSEATTHSQPPSNDHVSSSASAFPVGSFTSNSSAMPSLANTTVYQSSLPLLCSRTCQQYDSVHPLDYMNNHMNDTLDIDKGMIHDDNAGTSMGVSFSPIFDYGNIAPMMYRSASAAACGDDYSSDAAVAISPSRQQLCFAMSETTPPPPNLAARAIQSQLYLEATSKQALSVHRDFRAIHSKDEKRVAIRNSGTCEAREIVTFLVESSTPAIEDGYRWCKYGQKNIKDKLHPRCYFKCAHRHCPAKKQAEGSSSMPGFVLITYLGKHNHYN